MWGGRGVLAADQLSLIRRTQFRRQINHRRAKGVGTLAPLLKKKVWGEAEHPPFMNILKGSSKKGNPIARKWGVMAGLGF